MSRTRAKAPDLVSHREVAIAYAAAGMQPGGGRAEGLKLLYLLVKCHDCAAAQQDPWRACQHRRLADDWAAVKGRRG